MEQKLRARIAGVSVELVEIGLIGHARGGLPRRDPLTNLGLVDVCY